jgi:predicted SpoU family rRNA methylase
MEAQVLTALNGHVINSTMSNVLLKKVNDKEFEGSLSSIKRYWGGPKDVKVFFNIRFDKAPKAFKGWAGKAGAPRI